MEYNLILPYVETVQPGGLRYPVHVWWDGPGQRYRLDVYGGIDSNGWDTKKGITWNLYPRIKDIACDFSNGTVGPTARAASSREQLLMDLGLQDGAASTPLPDISDWEYAGTAQVRNTAAFVWQYAVRHGEKTAQYTFYTAQNGWPLKFYMMGLNLLTGSHFDEYVVEFTRFKPGPIADEAFKLPAVCEDAAGAARSAEELEQQRRRQAGAAARLGALLPASRVAAGPSAAALSSSLRSEAASAFEANARMVEEHNRRSGLTAAAYEDDEPKGEPSYTLALNHFAHMTHQQWAASMLGLSRPPKKLEASSGGSPRYYQRVLRDEELPESVDWRGTGADGPGVKDQVSCGSCWAFSAIGAMQGAWFKATGQSLSFSEQQLVDCSWEYGNNGCAGGWVEPAVQYVVDAGGVAQESDYQYTGQNTFCRGPAPSPSDPSSVARRAALASANPSPNDPPAPLSSRFKGYVNVPPRDEKALMEAVALHGPVAVVMNAARPPFKFYSEGVYYNPECKEVPDNMDHAIVLVGYGTTPEGVDYWIIKNSWSKYWGMDGYARVARKGNDCGITTDPVLALVDPEAAKGAAAV